MQTLPEDICSEILPHTTHHQHDADLKISQFFKNLNHGYAPGRDIYANRDLQAYEKGRQDVMRIIKSLDNLPQEIRRFYTIRLGMYIDRRVF